MSDPVMGACARAPHPTGVAQQYRTATDSHTSHGGATRQAGAVGTGAASLSAISDRELAAHVAECHLLMQLARARFRGSSSPADAAEAAMWQQAKEDAIRARQQAAVERSGLTQAERLDEIAFDGQWAMRLAREGGAA